MKNAWTLNGVDAVEGEVVITDFTGNEIDTISELYDWYTYKKTVSIAYTISPVTGDIDYIYVVNAGWDAKYTVALDKALTDAGWKITTDTTLTDDAAWAADNWTVTLANDNLKGVSTDYTFTMTVYEDGAKTGTDYTAKMVDGKLTITFNVADFSATVKEHSYVINGLTNSGEIKFTGTVEDSAYRVLEESLAAGKYVYGTPVEVDIRVTADTNGWPVDITFTSANELVADLAVKGVKTADVAYQTLTVTLYPVASSTYTLSSVVVK